MLKLIAVLFLAIGEIAAWEICEGFESCPLNDIPQEFPETNEELQEMCKPAIAFFECAIGVGERCPHFTEDRVAHMKEILGVIREVCSEETLLHAALVDNLACFKRIDHSDTLHCGIGEDQVEITQKIHEALEEEGLLSPTDNENDTFHLQECMGELNYVACAALVVEKMCGDLAMSAYAEIGRRIHIKQSQGCPKELLPDVIRLRREEEEKKSTFLEVLMKRK